MRVVRVTGTGQEVNAMQQVRSYRFQNMAEVEANAAAEAAAAAADAAGPSGSGAPGPASAALVDAEVDPDTVKTAYRVRLLVKHGQT